MRLSLAALAALAALAPLVAPAAAGAAPEVTRLAYAAGVTPSGLLVASQVLAVADEGGTGPVDVAIPIWLGESGVLGELELQGDGEPYRRLPEGAPATAGTFRVERRGPRAIVHAAVDATGAERELALSYDVRGVVEAGVTGALARVEPWGVGATLPADRVAIDVDPVTLAGDAPLRSARAIGAVLDVFDAREARIELRGAAPGERLGLEVALAPGALDAEPSDAAPRTGPLPAWADAPPTVVDDDEEAADAGPPAADGDAASIDAPLPEPSAPALTVPAVALPELTVPEVAVPPELARPGGDHPAILRLALILLGAVGGSVVALRRRASRRDAPRSAGAAVPRGPVVAPPAPPTPVQHDDVGPTGRGP